VQKAVVVQVEETRSQLAGLAEAAGVADDQEFTRHLRVAERYRQDEVEHLETGLAQGARDAPAYRPLTALIQTGSRAAIWLSQRL